MTERFFHVKFAEIFLESSLSGIGHHYGESPR